LTASMYVEPGFTETSLIAQVHASYIFNASCAQYAHANAFRQARELFQGPVHMLACVHSDAEIIKNKGPPLFDEQERYAVVAGCRWVDDVVEGVPYVTELDTLDKYHADFLVHGDDPVVVSVIWRNRNRLRCEAGIILGRHGKGHICSIKSAGQVYGVQAHGRDIHYFADSACPRSPAVATRIRLFGDTPPRIYEVDTGTVPCG